MKAVRTGGAATDAARVVADVADSIQGKAKATEQPRRNRRREGLGCEFAGFRMTIL